jgi:lecithin-cholesterol acyltransferase
LTPSFVRKCVALLFAGACASVVIGAVAAAAETIQNDHGQSAPVVLFPAFHFTRLKFVVTDQHVAPECPATGAFEDWFQNPNPSYEFSQACQDKLMTLMYVRRRDVQNGRSRFANQPGVHVRLEDFGSTASAPFYEPLYTFLEKNGYERDKNIRVAGYDSRLTPDLGGFLERTKALIEATYHANHNTPVHLVAHSNGPLYAQYLLTHTSQHWKNKYIHGFSPIAGNWPGQGIFYSVLFTGLNDVDFTTPADPETAAASARMYQSHPSSYMSAADPKVFGDQEIVLEAGGRDYTPEDNLQLFRDARLSLAEHLASRYVGFVKFRTPRFFPYVDVYAEKGSGLQTAVGLGLPDLTVGQVVGSSNAVFTRLGDTNQEDITNDSIEVWRDMPCFRFKLTDNPGVDHFSLPSNPGVLERLLVNLRRTKSTCSVENK